MRHRGTLRLGRSTRSASRAWTQPSTSAARTERKKREIRSSHIETTELLVRTLAALDPRPRVLLCAGGIDVYGERGDEILTEESELGTSGLLTEVG
jgi:NAD dependent epimerase/dehydratase family enzyme